MNGQETSVETIRHPMFNGVPILLGDTIEFANDPPSYDGAETGVVKEIRWVNGVPWIHVNDHEVIFESPTDTARGVVVHNPKDNS